MDSVAYVNQIETVLLEDIPCIRNILTPLYFRNFCDKLSFTFLKQFVECIFKCKKIDDFGAQQVLISCLSLMDASC